MENAPFFIFCLLSINNMSLKGHNDFYKDYIDLKNTFPVKGVFVWIIILFHYEQYYKREKKFLFEQIVELINQKMVTMFLFYSGYGIYESIKKKGNEYSKTIWKKSLIIYIKSQLILLIFVLRMAIFKKKKKLTFKRYILAMLFKSHVGNSNWFAFTIIVLYLYAFLAFVFIKDKKYNYLGIIFITIICSLHIYLMYNYYFAKRMGSVDNTLSYIFGFCYSAIRKFTDRFIMKYDFIYFGIFSVLSLTFYYLCKIKDVNILLHNLMNSNFSLIVLLITMKVRLDNEFLKFLNIHSYSIYLLQKVVLRTFFEEKYLIKYECMRIILQFVLILFIATIFDYYTSFIDKCFKKVDHRLEAKENFKLFEESQKNHFISNYIYYFKDSFVIYLNDSSSP